MNTDVRLKNGDAVIGRITEETDSKLVIQVEDNGVGREISKIQNKAPFVSYIKIVPLSTEDKLSKTNKLNYFNKLNIT